MIHGEFSDPTLKMGKIEGLSIFQFTLDQGYLRYQRKTYLHNVVIIMFYLIQAPREHFVRFHFSENVNLQYGGCVWDRGDNKMRGWSKISDFDKIFICLFIVSNPYTLSQFGGLLKDLVFQSQGSQGEGLYKITWWVKISKTSKLAPSIKNERILKNKFLRQIN